MAHEEPDNRRSDGGEVSRLIQSKADSTKPMKRLLISTFALFAMLEIVHLPKAAQELPYTEGSVFEMAFIRTLPGGYDAYMKFLQTEWKKVNEAAKKEGLILSYDVGTASPANKEDWDIVLIIEYKNMAALDGLEEKLRDVAEKAVGPSEKHEDRSKERGKIREVLGTKLVRQLKLK